MLKWLTHKYLLVPSVGIPSTCVLYSSFKIMNLSIIKESNYNWQFVALARSCMINWWLWQSNIAIVRGGGGFEFSNVVVAL